MFDFGETIWDVDKTAEDLNTSLFGHAKKKKQLKKKNTDLCVSKVATPTILDSDDETYSKKGKRKIKERKRKQNKSKSKPNEAKNTEHVNDDSTNMEINSLDTRNVKEERQAVADGQILVKPKKRKGVEKLVADSSKKGRATNMIEPDTANEVSGAMKKKGMKRKKQDLDMLNNTSEESYGSKKMKLSEESNSIDPDTSETVNKKKKRKNKKKKNNSKKNKYKHLALNKKTEDIFENDIGSNGAGHEYLGHEDKSKAVNIQGTKEELIECTNRVKQKKKKAGKNENVPDISKKSKLTKEKSVKSDLLLDLDDTVLSKASKKKKKLKPLDKNDISNPEMNVQTVQKLQDTMIDKVNNVHVKTKQNKAKLKSEVLAAMLKESASQEKVKSKKTIDILKKDSSDSKQKCDISPKLGMKKTDLEISKSSLKSESDSQKSIWGKSSILGQQAREKLDSARFRFINEQLYTCKGNDAFKMFREDKEAFHVYHDGYKNQVSKWEVNPLKVIIKQLSKKADNLVIADFGCGDASLSENLTQKVHSFDLVALNDRVTVCDMSKTPLPNDTVDVAVFCLSLMGTNLNDYIHEANRVLKTGGILKIAEVTSRFSGLSSFISAVSSQGFQLLNKRDLSQMFYLMDFKKVKNVKKSVSAAEINLKPCVYKKR